MILIVYAGTAVDVHRNSRSSHKHAFHVVVECYRVMYGTERSTVFNDRLNIRHHLLVGRLLLLGQKQQLK